MPPLPADHMKDLVSTGSLNSFSSNIYVLVFSAEKSFGKGGALSEIEGNGNTCHTAQVQTCFDPALRSMTTELRLPACTITHHLQSKFPSLLSFLHNISPFINMLFFLSVSVKYLSCAGAMLHTDYGLFHPSSEQLYAVATLVSPLQKSEEWSLGRLSNSQQSHRW